MDQDGSENNEWALWVIGHASNGALETWVNPCDSFAALMMPNKITN